MKEGEMGPVPVAAWQRAVERCLKGLVRFGRRCILWLVLPILVLVLLSKLLNYWAFYDDLGSELEFGPPCDDASHEIIGRVKPDELTAEARALLLQWPRKLWPIGYYMRIEGDKITVKYVVYVLFMWELQTQTGKDAAELYRITGRQPKKGSRADSYDCDDYIKIGTKKGVANAWSLSDTYDTLMSYHIGHDPPRELVAHFLGKSTLEFKGLLFKKNIDPFTGQALPPPPAAPMARPGP